MTKRFMSETEEIKAYQEAVWSYLLEHCDILPTGGIFVKFHTKDKHTFQNHIRGRWIHGYHRNDKRTGETAEEKEKRSERLRLRREIEKEIKSEIHRKRVARLRQWARLKTLLWFPWWR